MVKNFFCQQKKEKKFNPVFSGGLLFEQMLVFNQIKQKALKIIADIA